NNHPSTTYPLGSTIVTWTVTDAAGNTAQCNQTVNVTDNVLPTITCPGNIVVNTGAGVCTASVVNPNPVFNDNCSVTILAWGLSGATTGNSAPFGINF